MKTNKNTLVEKENLLSDKKRFMKLLAPFIALFVVCMSLFTICLIENNNLNKRFISPTQTDVYEQKGDTYIIATYFQESSTYSFLKELRKIERKYNIPFYLVDVQKYGDELISAWGLEYSPTYFIMQRDKTEDKSAKLLYKSYGAKKYDVLMAEIDYCEENGGIPIDHTGQTVKLKDSDITITLSKVEKQEDDSVKILFDVKNNTGENFDFSNSWASVTSFDGKTTASVENGGVTILANTEGQIELFVTGVSANKLKITLTIDGSSENKFSWGISKLDRTISLK